MDIISRKESLIKGLKKYFTGKLCKNGHLSERYSKDGVCCECGRIKLKKHQYLYPGKRNNCKKDNPEKSRNQCRDYRNFPIPTRPYPTNNLCECCNNLEYRKKGDGTVASLALDHNHITGKFRGWLCFGCNTGIGKLGDSSRGIYQAAEYLALSEPDIQACY